MSEQKKEEKNRTAWNLAIVLLIIITSQEIVCSPDATTSIEKPNISLEREIYSTDERIPILLTGITPSYSLEIESETKLYKYSGETTEQMDFYAREEGEYTIKVIDDEKNSMLSSKSFKVIKNYFTKNESMIYTEKEKYGLNEEVLIKINIPAEPRNFELTIVSAEESLKFLDELKPELRFIPKKTGEYKIQLRENFEPLAQATFFVVDTAENTSQSQDKTPEKNQEQNQSNTEIQ
jgi:hypothetical protein